MSRIQELAKLLDEARVQRRDVDRLTSSASLTLPEAYEIQAEGIRLREARGERVIGMKMGLTSKAKMLQMGVESPIRGVLVDTMKVPDQGIFSYSSAIHPRVEPEIVYWIGKDLDGKASRSDVLGSIEAVALGLEILDSRYKDFSFTLPDVVADNTSACGFVCGPKADPGLDLSDLSISLEIDDKVIEIGRSSAILGHPADSVVELCRMLATAGQSLKAGSIVLAGSPTAAVKLNQKTRVRALASVLPPVSFRSE